MSSTSLDFMMAAVTKHRPGAEEQLSKAIADALATRRYKLIQNWRASDRRLKSPRGKEVDGLFKRVMNFGKEPDTRPAGAATQPTSGPASRPAEEQRQEVAGK
jgi:hypothetical protein